MKFTRPKTVQIDYDLFQQMITYISTHYDMEDPDWTSIQSGINDKLNALERRAVYTMYKEGISPEARERGRQEYLDLLGIPDSFRWSASRDVNVTHESLWL